MHRPRGRIGTLVAIAIPVLLVVLGVGALVPKRVAADEPILTVQVGATPQGQAMPPGFIGFSMEYKAMHLYTGRNPAAVNPLLLQLIRQLTPGQSPVLRIGGDSTDQTWWPVRGMIPPVGVTYSLTQGWMRATQALARALGAKLILGINLAGGRPAVAGAEARALLEGIGRRYIQAFEIGNEPDLYGIFAWFQDRRGRVVFARPSSYSVSGLERDFTRWRSAMPVTPLAGPAFSGVAWMSRLGAFITSQPKLAVVTFHRYPLRGCVTDPADPGYASIPNLMADSSSQGVAQTVAPYAATAHSHGLPFRLDELNSASCSGRAGVSDTFSSALWVLDTLFNLASVGVDGINIHTLPGAAYQPFVFTQKGKTWQVSVRPLYYGLMMFSQAFPAGAQLLPVTSPSGDVKAWATQGTDGATRVVLINKDPTTTVQIQLQLPGNPTSATIETLQAPSLSSTSGVTIGGQSFGTRSDAGRLRDAPRTTLVEPVGGQYSIQLPPGSAVLLTR